MKIRTEIPKNNKNYMVYSSGGYSGCVKGYPTIPTANVLCNCVGYANSRFNEIINNGEEKPFKYQLVCNAENFIESAKRQGLKISSKPTVGGIMVWKKGSTLGGGDGAGHVAIVEQIYEDGSIYTSESGWGSMDWAFKNLRRNNKNGRWGQNSLYTFRGCIINPSIKDSKPLPTPKLVVDGIGGTATVMRMQEFFKVSVIDGVISGQKESLSEYYPSLKEVQYGRGGSATVKALQKWLGGKTCNGVIGEKTVKAWQRKLNSLGYSAGVVDGIFGKKSMKAWQECLNNNGKKKSSPTPSPTPIKKKYKVIDVSEFQDNINWTKAKADGVQGAIIRCGFRGATSGKLQTDAMFLNHIKGAHKAGIPVGIYMFTEAINSAEGKEEADYAIKLWQTAGVPISFPIAIDTEAVNIKDERAKNLTKAQRTNAIKGFCQQIKAKGYMPMIYASTSWLNSKLDMSKLPYDVWVAQYNDVCEYKGEYIIWQYTSRGKVAGVNGNVDLNHCYIAPKKVDPPKAPAKKGYTGDYPNINRAKMLIDKAVELAWKKGTAESKYKYPSGSATDKFNVALDKVYPNRKSWGKAARVGASCDVFVGTCVKSCGFDSKFPRGLEQQMIYNAHGFIRQEYKNVKPVSKSADGDIVMFSYNGGSHTVIRGNGMYYEANFEKYFGHTNTSLERLKKSYPKVVILRPKNYLEKGDSGSEVKNLQNYLIWMYGKKLTADGIFGDTTEAYVKMMQKAFNLEEDGIVGAKTLAKMKAYKK